LLVNSRGRTIYTNHTIEYRPARFTLRVPIDATTDGGHRRRRPSRAPRRCSGSWPSTAGPGRPAGVTHPRERGTVRTARPRARENRGELPPEPAVITPSGRTAGRDGDRRLLINSRRRYIQMSHAYRTSTTPRISSPGRPPGDRADGLGAGAAGAAASRRADGEAHSTPRRCSRAWARCLSVRSDSHVHRPPTSAAVTVRDPPSPARYISHVFSLIKSWAGGSREVHTAQPGGGLGAGAAG